MSVFSNISDENFDIPDEKDEDFNIDEYMKENDSEDSSSDVPETYNEEKEKENQNKVDGDKDQTNEYIGPILPGDHRFDKKLICVKYPGNVINPDKAVETLGGIKSISTAVNTPNRRLELRFRPHDGYCKPTCGDRHSTNGFLLRIRIKKSKVQKSKAGETKEGQKQSVSNVNLNKNHDKNVDRINIAEAQHSNVGDCFQRVQTSSCNVLNDPAGPSKDLLSENVKDLQDLSLDTSDANLLKSGKNIAPTFDRNKYQDLSEDKDYELPKLKVLARIDTEFKFMNLCDFQYLPMTQSTMDSKRLECIYDKIYPNNIPPFSWLKNDVPYFLPPAAFSRMDTMQHYVPKTEVSSYPDNVIGKSRKRKSGFSNFIYFSTPEVPTKPPSGIETAMKVKFIQNVQLEQIRQIFEERPIWSKNAIMYKTKFSSERLKFLLPAVAYYFITGPWKIMWVRLGYDPRKDPSAKKYQTLDYRLKAMHGLGSTVKCKRNYSAYTLPYKSTPAAKQKMMAQNAGSSQERGSKKGQDYGENVYIYRVGTIPPSRQMFYQMKYKKC
ncbi:general transcription factor 3C polypeptide 5 isoform X2 [Ceratina calcarata]|uniref:General transcription factor 3C polypeptide 5 isoform X2 n=1 Tax=Ceratina calcarata TaxID=156304 RepID=A0AAJ7IX31_9HYME|nr:general transcription factor 3C polypeptide 5 isoform X2 [Ceratina calcarata]